MTMKTEEKTNKSKKHTITSRTSFIDSLKILGVAEQAWQILQATKSPEKVFDFVRTIPGFPKEKLPTAPGSIAYLMNQIRKEFAQVAETNASTRSISGFSDLLTGLDKVLQIDAGAPGAVYQNMIKACLLKIQAIEACPIRDGKTNPEANIIKYVEQIRLLIGNIESASRNQSQLKADIRAAAEEQTNLILNAVREVLYEICPDKVEDFIRLLNGKLSTGAVIKPEGNKQ